MTDFVIAPGGQATGLCHIPGDKSISHRAIMLAAISEGQSRVSGYLASEDCIATRHAFEAMGVTITDDGDDLIIDGVGLNGLQAPKADIYLGNSGTGMRLMVGLLAGQQFDSVLTGDASLSSRPMGRVVNPLISMGADIDTEEGQRAPLRIFGKQKLAGITYQPPVASAQIKSCLLLAGLYAEGETVINEPGISRDHSERMLKAFGADVQVEERRVSIQGQPKLVAQDVVVPADLSSAAFFIVAALIARDSELVIPAVGMNPSRNGVIKLLRAMGGDIELSNTREISGEPIADLTVRSSKLHGIDIGGEDVPLSIDEFPALFIAAACAKGTTRLRDAHELRVKESDRIAVMAEGLATLGVKTQVYDDGIDIEGNDGDAVFGGGSIATYHDHRIAMAFTMASLRAREAITIHDCEVINTSFPQFVQQAKQVGIQLP